jgi:aminopeptidase N
MYFPDRPDVLSLFDRVTLRADAAAFPTLLSNGNLLSDSVSADGRTRTAVWQDPHPKPCYLFALVAGDLAHISGEFVTGSGRTVDLRVYSEPKDQHALQFALQSLARSMAWDERRYGLEYDLDRFNIVATDTFNMGAMENKSLNIFNTSYLVGSPARSTDGDLEGIARVVAHEYFHNWTGNRVTCRDWFQLTLKEGLTVFRDQQFSADVVCAPSVQRIDEVCVCVYVHVYVCGCVYAYGGV